MKNLAPRLFLCFASAFSVCAVHAQKGVSWLNELQQPCAKKHATYKQHVTQLPSGLYLKLLLDINGGDTLLRATYDHPSCKDMYRHGSYLFKEEGQLRDSGNYFRGKPHGYIYRRLDNLPGYSLCRYSKGVMDGPCISRYDNGILADTFNLVQGKESGLRLKYYPNGVLKSRTAYEQGKRQGMQAGWDSAGRLLNRSFYKDDLADGYSMRYGSSRNLMEKGSYRAGKKVGSWYFYHSKGSLASYERYNDSGMMLFVQHYDEQGKPQTFDSLRQYREAGPSGGLNAFYEAISKEYHVPPEAIKKNLETQIELCFEIDEQGNPVNLRACNEPRLAKVLEDEALRSFNAIKTQWNPQWQHNRPVSTHYKLPIKVTIMR